jgi:ABC-2 type transport system ATP-binding protein
MIRADQLSKVYGSTHALRGLSFEVGAGEIVGLVGKNGAGKSTALSILCGQLLPSGGDAFVDGCSVSRESLAVRRRIAYLRYLARLRGVPAGALSDRVRTVIARTGLAGREDAPLGTLSRGYRQRAGIAQAIVHDPPVVLLDEPMAGLDPVQIIQMRDLIAGLKPAHTVLFSTHILSEVTRICDRVIVIDRGLVRAAGSETALRAGVAGRQRLRLLVRGGRAAVETALGSVPGATVVLAPGSAADVWVAHVQLPEDAREQVSRAVVQAGLGLLELRAESDELERLMVELLDGRGSAAA